MIIKCLNGFISFARRWLNSVMVKLNYHNYFLVGLLLAGLSEALETDFTSG